jgi:hypothetical protein
MVVDTTARSSTQADPTHMRNTLGLLLQPGQVTELRALEVTTPDYRRPHTVSGYFDAQEALWHAVMELTPKARGIYIVPNPIHPALLARAANRMRTVTERDALTSDADILKRHWLMIDADARRPSGISSTEVEHRAALDRARQIRDVLAADGWAQPILADSGNGAHLLYRIDLPVDDGGLVKRTLEALAFRFDDDLVTIDQKVFNPARIWKLYGTVARKGDDTPDRPHRLARLLEVS